jgi:hypothetical protein
MIAIRHQWKPYCLVYLCRSFIDVQYFSMATAIRQAIVQVAERTDAASVWATF